MVRKEFSEGKKGKPRGRPFAKGHKPRKPSNDVLDSSGHEIINERGVVASDPQDVVKDKTKHEKSNVLNQLPSLIDKTIKEAMNTPQEEEQENNPSINEPKALELIDSLDFKNGENTLTIRFSKKHNRMFRIQMFLNDESEIKPMTYTGSSTGYTFWNLLKGSLKK